VPKNCVTAHMCFRCVRSNHRAIHQYARGVDSAQMEYIWAVTQKKPADLVIQGYRL